MTAKNPLKRITELNAEIDEAMELMQVAMKPYQDTITDLEKQRDECFQYAVKHAITNQGGYVMKIVSQLGRKTRAPRHDDVISKLEEKFGNKSGVQKALEIAKFEIKSLQSVFSETEIDEVSDIKQNSTGSRIVEKEE
jgi:hypothetical protein